MATPSPLDNINSAIANVSALIAEVTANPQPSYSVQGVSVSWNEYLDQLTKQMAALQEVMIFLSGPYELVSVGVP